MNHLEIVEKLKNHKGQHILVIWQRAMKTRASITASVQKRVYAHVRTGIDYSKLSSVKEGIESGERGEVQPLKWGTWELFPFIITHIPKGQTEPVKYVRMYPAVFENLQNSIRAEYLINGVIATREQVEPMVLASEFGDEEPTCFTVKADSVVSIG